jgi:hypothetical protein
LEQLTAKFQELEANKGKEVALGGKARGPGRPKKGK